MKTYICKAALASIAAAHALQEISASNEEFDYDLEETAEDNWTDELYHVATDLAQTRLEANAEDDEIVDFENTIINDGTMIEESEEFSDEDYASSGSDASDYEGLALAAAFSQYSQANPTCTTAQERLREGPEEDFYEYLAGVKRVKRLSKEGFFETYKDLSFLQTYAYRWNQNPHIQADSRYPKSLKDLDKIRTKKIHEEYPSSEGYSLFGDDGKPTPKDIRNGSLSDSWFLAAASAMAEIPERMEKVFVDTDHEHSPRGISDFGIYAVNMYALMMPIKVTIADRLPFRKVKKCTNYLVAKDCSWSSKHLEFAKVGDDKSVWAPLLESAFAKYHGTYEAINDGSSMEALQVLAGSPGDYMHSGKDGNDALWDKLTALEDTTMVTAVASKDWKGIVGNRSYTVLRAVQVGDGPRLIEVRNTYGEGEFEGAYGYKSSRWTDKLKADYHYTDKDNGKFFIGYEAYQYAFDTTYFNYDTSDWTRASFLMLGDLTQPVGENQGQYALCGETCVRHEFTLESAVKQKVIVSASTYQLQGYPAACEPEGKHGHAFNVEGISTLRWDFGTVMMDEFEMAAGETKTVWVEMDYSADMMKDFSVVAWGKEGGLTLTNNQGLQSDEFPDINPDALQ